jgi:hypothetical protein
MDDYWELNRKAEADRIKWEFRDKQIEDLKNRWFQDDLLQAQKKREADFLSRDSLNQNYGFPSSDYNSRDRLFQVRKDQEAERFLWDLRDKQIEDLKNSWYQEDMREAEDEKRFRWLRDDWK